MIRKYILRFGPTAHPYEMVDAGETYSLTLKLGDEKNTLSNGDYILTYQEKPIEKINCLLQVQDVLTNKLKLEKKIEVARGVSPTALADFPHRIKSNLLDNQKILFEISEDEWDYLIKHLVMSLCDIEGVKKMQSSPTEKLQALYYGSPGTGKSHKIKKETEGQKVYRTTFHPDTDYASFVGAYKPTMKKGAADMEDNKLVSLTDVYEVNAETHEVDEENHIHKLIHKQRVGITYEFVPQVFTKAYIEAWKNLLNPAEDSNVSPVYLVIEEINRGNCAQVFGDIFQLLDRNDRGYSEYPIVPDSDLGAYIAGELNNAGVADENLKQQINSLYEDYVPLDNEQGSLVDDILAGKALVLPRNLYIRATMNTSDQSLFPMDSAFKRRWNWEYVPIKDEGKGYKIKVDETNSYAWWEFLGKINEKILDVTGSVDKQLGYFFVKLPEGQSEISAEIFVNKVVFYLWDSIFKDCYREAAGELFKMPDKIDGKTYFTFMDLFNPDGKLNSDLLKTFFTNLELKTDSENDGQTDTEEQAQGESPANDATLLADNSDIGAQDDSAASNATTQPATQNV